MRKNTTNSLRAIIQAGVIIFILLLLFFPKIFSNGVPDFEAYCPFGGLQALGSYMLNGSLACTMTSSQIAMGVLLMLAVFVFSKLFCAYICPVGTISEWIGKLGEKLKIRITIKDIADKILRSLKYVLLFITLFFTLQSSELFCKKFDPYFALTSGFDSDVVVLYAAIAIAVVVLGSLFIRMFWCKYLCPLGAISNIFKFTVFFIALMLIYIVLLHFGLKISYVWPLSVACFGAYIMEIITMKSKLTPLAKITRNASTCTNCNLCSKKCPQGIDVASLTKVSHVDCTLCGDCLLVCPAKDTLSINKQPKLKRLPVVAIILLVIGGIFWGNSWEVPTIDMHWGTQQEVENAAVYTQSGLKSVKCFGSSKAFANKMRKFDGVYGVATYVKHHRVKIYYNPDIISEDKLQEKMFTPQKKLLKKVSAKADTIYEVTLKLENFFDTYDFNYLSYNIRKETNAVGILSQFGCPVTVKLFFQEPIKDNAKLLDLVEAESMEVKTKDGSKEIELGYEIVGKPEYFTLSKKEYYQLMFIPFEKKFNHREEYSADVLGIYSFPMGDKNAKQKRRLSYLISHISNDLGVVSFNTTLDKDYEEIVEITYVDTMTNIDNINKALLSDSLTISYSDGHTGKVANMFDFSSSVSEE